MDENLKREEEEILQLTKKQDECISMLTSNAVLPYSLLSKKEKTLALLKSELSLNIEVLSECADGIITKNPEISQTALTVELLKTLAETQGDTRLGKIAKGMIKKKWWEHHE